MDHHCPWVNNCLGFYNYKFFVLYLAYAILYCIFLSLLSLVVLLNRSIYKTFEKSTTQPFQIYILVILALAFMVGVFFLEFFHLTLIWKNRTTLEESRASNFVDGIKISPYNYGVRKNWIEVFGSNPFMWFLPVFSGVGDGLEFPVTTNQLMNLSP